MKTLTLTLLAVSTLVAVEGNSKSAVRVIIYEDLQCSDCAAFRTVMDQQLLPRYGDRVAFEHRDFPLPKHKWAGSAAIAGRYFDSVSGALGVEFRRWAMNNIERLTPENFDTRIAQWATSHGVDSAKAVAALNDQAITKAIEEDYQEGVARGVSRTPTVFVNGEPFIEKVTAEEISKGIEVALAATGK